MTIPTDLVDGKPEADADRAEYWASRRAWWAEHNRITGCDRLGLFEQMRDILDAWHVRYPRPALTDRRPGRWYRLVSRDGVAPMAEMQGYMNRAIERHRRQYGAPDATVEALAHLVRTEGIAALRRPTNRHRMATLSPDQLKELHERLRKRGRKNAHV